MKISEKWERRIDRFIDITYPILGAAIVLLWFALLVCVLNLILTPMGMEIW